MTIFLPSACAHTTSSSSVCWRSSSAFSTSGRPVTQNVVPGAHPRANHSSPLDPVDLILLELGVGEMQFAT